MIAYDSVWVQLLRRVERIPAPPLPKKRGRGRPAFYSDRLFRKALVIRIVPRLHKGHELRSVLAEPTREMQAVRSLLMEQGRYPLRRTFERRLKRLPQRLPGQIAALGAHLVTPCFSPGPSAAER